MEKDKRLAPKVKKVKKPKSGLSISLKHSIAKNWQSYFTWMLVEEDPNLQKLYTTIYIQYIATFKMLYNSEKNEADNMPKSFPKQTINFDLPKVKKN